MLFSLSSSRQLDAPAIEVRLKKKKKKGISLQSESLCSDISIMFTKSIFSTCWIMLMWELAFHNLSCLFLGDLIGLIFYQEYKEIECYSPNIFITCLIMLVNNMHMVTWETQCSHCSFLFSEISVFCKYCKKIKGKIISKLNFTFLLFSVSGAHTTPRVHSFLFWPVVLDHATSSVNSL